MGFRHNNLLHNNHFHKDWQRRVRVWFDQAGRKKSRRNARAAKAAALGMRPVQALRPAVRGQTLKYNTKLRQGRGFTIEELKAAGIRKVEARSIGIPVDHRRKNKSEESLKLNADRLKAYKERLIVLPRRTKKNKNQMPDLSSVQTTRATLAAFPIPAGTTWLVPSIALRVLARLARLSARRRLLTRRSKLDFSSCSRFAILA